MTAIFIRRPPRSEKERQNKQPGQNEELVPKRGTTSVAWSRVFKHCSFKTTDFKPLKLKQQTYMRAPSLSVWEERAFSFLLTLNNYINTYMRQNPRLYKYPHKHSDLGLKRENGRKRKRICNSNLAFLDPDFALKGEAFQNSFMLIIAVTYIGRNSTVSTRHRKNQRLSKTPPPSHQRKSARFRSVTEQREVATRRFPRDTFISW